MFFHLDLPCDYTWMINFQEEYHREERPFSLHHHQGFMASLVVGNLSLGLSDNYFFWFDSNYLKNSGLQHKFITE
jgi:hypothetical protein